MQVNAAGDLVLHSIRGNIVQHAPQAYQTIEGMRQVVASRYVLSGDQVGFAVGTYDLSRTLVIDPMLTFSTYLGGQYGDQAFAVAVDPAGNAYVTGEVGSPDFPKTTGARPNHGLNTVTDVFVTKFKPNGQLAYSTFLGGSSDDHGTGIAVDSSGNAYITGWTSQSTDYPTTANAFQKNYKLRMDGFVTKLNSAGTGLVYSTYIGGTSDDMPAAIAVDSSGQAFIAGDTVSMDFPTKNPIQGGVANSMDDGFLTKFNATGSALIYSTYLRGTGRDAIHGLAVDRFGNAVVTGETYSTDFPTTANAFQKTFNPPSKSALPS